MEVTSVLRNSLETGFIGRAHESYSPYQPQLVVNSKRANTKILSTILRELKTCESFIFSVAFLTTSGVAVLYNCLEELAQRGVKGQVLVSQYQNFTQPDALVRLGQLPNIELRIVTEGDFHAKGYIFRHKDSYSLIVGSSNLTANALTRNKEWNLRVTALSGSKIIFEALEAFKSEFDQAPLADADFIQKYREIYQAQRNFTYQQARVVARLAARSIVPNKMQQEALSNLVALRAAGKDKALLISATGTGKTFLSAFDVQRFKPRRMLFLVHRRTIANKALESYEQIFGDAYTMGFVSGSNKDVDRNFVFSTIQTMSRDENMLLFDPTHFDYIVIDETHRAGAATYQKLLQHFKPQFLLGMTATPERTDGFDIFNQFDYNIAYEIRLHRALQEDMLCPFHYYGITDIQVDEKELDKESNFLKLVSEERINHIIERSQKYGCDEGRIRGLVFCNSNKVSAELARAFNQRGLYALALSGDSSEGEREEAIERLESDDPDRRLDYVFSVDIFNEGVDIPRVNQILMLRPTQSAIVFVQQLGRGLRKTDGKEYLTVIDFIANYSNNYLVPIALYGDASYNKDNLRKLLAGESEVLPGASTVNFERIAKERIFDAINKAKMSRKTDLVNDYTLLKFQLGRSPMMMDFVNHGSRDPYLYVDYSRSYYNFVAQQEPDIAKTLAITPTHTHLLALFSKEIANGKRVEEALMLQLLIDQGAVDLEALKSTIFNAYKYVPTHKTLLSAVNNVNFFFITENSDLTTPITPSDIPESGSKKKTKKEKASKIKVGLKYNYHLVEMRHDMVVCTPQFLELLAHDGFKRYLLDVLAYGVHVFSDGYDVVNWMDGFVLARKYSRKDAFRILNWDENPVAQNVGGYMVSKDKADCAAFINYHKADSISATTQYEDVFVDRGHFDWMSKSKRKLSSPDVVAITGHVALGMRIPLFVKKHNDEGQDFYYMGDMEHLPGKVSSVVMADGKTSAVRMGFKLSHGVESGLYRYITDKG